MRLLTFNLESLGTEKEHDPDLAARIAVLRPQIVAAAADILCLQEVNGQKPAGGGPRRLTALDRLLEGLPAAGFERVSTSRDDGGTADVHNLVILSRFPIRAAREIRQDLIDAPLYRRRTAEPADEAPLPVTWDRPILTAEIELPHGRVLHLFNVHFRAPLAAPVPGQKTGPQSWKTVPGWAEGYFLATMKRVGQALELRRAVDQVFDRDRQALIAVAGDFNAEEFHSAMRIAIGSVEDTGAAELGSRSLSAVEWRLPAPDRFTAIHLGRHMMPDHIVVSRALASRLGTVDIDNADLVDEAAGAAPIGSFHAPMVAEFEGI
ncbi:MAG: endonuclease/exonuclease/phosphatase family protein [Hyphomicrobiales bacterium]|nr:endonuclease/exonuclease/phosphatase family protein [Hyphomicrobiales bacterium]